MVVELIVIEALSISSPENSKHTFEIYFETELTYPSKKFGNKYSVNSVSHSPAASMCKQPYCVLKAEGGHGGRFSRRDNLTELEEYFCQVSYSGI